MQKLRRLLALTALFALVLCSCSSPSASTSPSSSNNPTTEATTTTAETTASGWDAIAAKGELIVGLDDTFAPMGFRDEDNTLVGFDIDLATAVCEKLGVTVKFQPIDWDAKELELSSKNIDCIWNGMSKTPEREASMSLTRGYINNRIIIMLNEGVNCETKEDLKELEIGIQSDSSALSVLKADEIYSSLDTKKVHEYKTYDECIMDMDAGRIDAMVVDEVLGQYKNSKRDKKFTVSSINLADDLYVVGCRKEDSDVATKIEEGINAVIADGKATEISQKWFGEDIVITATNDTETTVETTTTAE